MRTSQIAATNVSMKITLRLLAAAAAAAVLGVTPAQAIIGGAPDTAHPYVGVAGFLDSGGHHLSLCSGFLTSSNLFVTAGHCAGPGAPGAPQPAFAFIWFGSGPVNVASRPDAIGAAIANPAWNGSLPDHDIGAVRIFKSYIDLPALGHATLAPRGYLDNLAKKRGQQDVSFTSVGYGVIDASPAGVVAPFMRFAGSMQLEHLTDIDLFTTASAGNGTGGGATCVGDSGGPVFSGDYVVALVSAGTKYCNGKAADFRLDTFEAQNFIATAGS
jgi:hypothetical protein